MAEKRFDKYPQISRLVQAMTPEGRELVAHWHRVLITALEGYAPQAKKEARESWGMLAGKGAEMALSAWLRVMREVAGTIVDPKAADWCCAPGMLASPNPCPQHGFHPDRDYEPGVIIERMDGGVRERAVKVRHMNDLGWWRSIDLPAMYDQARGDLDDGGWVVVGRA